MEAEGDEKNLEQFIEWCRRGPERAIVTKVEVEEAPLKNFSSFEVNRGMH